MRVDELILKKRDGGTLTREEISFLVEGYTRGTLPDYQMGAWLMAVYFRGMTPAETTDLTEVMLRSGQVLDLSDLPGAKVDKHSTGGVGDKTSLVIAPVVAAAGVLVPMISGRGLAHTGGTLDKLEAIPGFRVGLSLQEFREALKTVGCGLVGQTEEIAPADKKIYALRDVTGTVESIPLITSSILSKKLAEGIDALILDVKVGSGAFMKELEGATRLAQSLLTIGRRMGKRVVALLTNMDQPLGEMVGNALEVAEAIEVLQGAGPDDLRQLCRDLSAWMLVLGGRARDLGDGQKQFDDLIRSGAAAKKFEQIIARQGGDAQVVRHPQRLPQARSQALFPSPGRGYVAKIHSERIGRAAMVLGAGRREIQDRIDPAVGLRVHKKVGERVEVGETLATLYYNNSEHLRDAQAHLESAFRFATEPPPPISLVLQTLSESSRI